MTDIFFCSLSPHLASTCKAFVQLTIRHDTKLILQNKNDLFPSFFSPFSSRCLKQSKSQKSFNHRTREFPWREKYLVCGLSKEWNGIWQLISREIFHSTLVQVFLKCLWTSIICTLESEPWSHHAEADFYRFSMRFGGKLKYASSFLLMAQLFNVLYGHRIKSH